MSLGAGLLNIRIEGCNRQDSGAILSRVNKQNRPTYTALGEDSKLLVH